MELDQRELTGAGGRKGPLSRDIDTAGHVLGVLGHKDEAGINPDDAFRKTEDPEFLRSRMAKGAQAEKPPTVKEQILSMVADLKAGFMRAITF